MFEKYGFNTAMIFMEHINSGLVGIRTCKQHVCPVKALTLSIFGLLLASIGPWCLPSYGAPVNKGGGGEHRLEKPADKGSEKGTEKGTDKTEPKETTEKSEKTKPLKWPPEPVLENVHKVTTDELVDKPHEFLNKNVKFTANFYAFSNLALDFKPALRPAKEYLSFLVHRTGSHIPFSELKLAMKIPKEKDPENQLLAQLKDGDQIDILGKVFATPLDEPWVDVVWLKKIETAKEGKKAALDETDSPNKPQKKKEKPAGLEEESKSDGNKSGRTKLSPREILDGSKWKHPIEILPELDKTKHKNGDNTKKKVPPGAH